VEIFRVRRTEHRELQGEGEEPLKGSKFLFLFTRKTTRASAAPGCATYSIAISKSVEPRRSRNNFAIFGNVPMRVQLWPSSRGGMPGAVRCRIKPMIAAAKMHKRHLLNLLNYQRYRLIDRPLRALTRASKPPRPVSRSIPAVQTIS
jgi:hypothetical protein